MYPEILGGNRDSSGIGEWGTGQMLQLILVIYDEIGVVISWNEVIQGDQRRGEDSSFCSGYPLPELCRSDSRSSHRAKRHPKG